MEIADGVLTEVLIRKGIAIEGNPFLFGMIGEPGFLILKVLGVLLAVIILWDIHRRHPRLAFWLSSAFLLFYTGVVIWNTSLLILGS